MSVFTEQELAYLTGQRRLARIATAGSDGAPHVVPVGWSHNAQHDTIDVTGATRIRARSFAMWLATGAPQS